MEKLTEKFCVNLESKASDAKLQHLRPRVRGTANDAGGYGHTARPGTWARLGGCGLGGSLGS